MANTTIDSKAIEAALGQVNSGNEQEVYKGRLALQRAIAAAGAPGQDGPRKEVAKSLAAAFQEKVKKDGKEEYKYSARARCEIAALLADIGGDDEVAALESALGDLDVRGAARWALDRIPTAAATAALVKSANESIGSRYRVGVMNSLGQRTGDKVVETLKQWAAEDPTLEVRLAAAEALANHPDTSAYAVINKLLETPLSEQDQGRLWKASVRLAGAVAASGNKQAASRMYRAIAGGNAPEPQKKAASAAADALG